MNIHILDQTYKNQFNKLAVHPLQSWEWGEFRRKTGIEVIRLGRFSGKKLLETAQVSIHPLSPTSFTIGYFPKGSAPSKEMLNKLVEMGKSFKCIFIKLEPNITKNNWDIKPDSSEFILKLSSHPLFTKYSFQLDLTRSEEELLQSMHSKTRYNIKVAQKHKVEIIEDNSREAFENYLSLLAETTARQKFYAHNRRYHTLMFETLGSAKMAHLLKAIYRENGKTHILVCWILLLFNNVLYYPYGASKTSFRHLMTSNLMMWEAIRWGKKHGAKIFDMWGSLGPNPSFHDPWYGFHRFKQGYSPTLVEFAGSFDLIINPSLYKIYNLSYSLRQQFLKLKRLLSKNM